MAIDSYEGRVYAGLYGNPAWKRPIGWEVGAESDPRPMWQFYLQRTMAERGDHVGGFGLLGYHESRPVAIRPVMRVVMVPHWFLAALAGLSPAFKIAGLVRRRPRAGLCHRCGYDLRATPGRCPECGTSVAKLAPSGG